jgi:hypothetical protein
METHPSSASNRMRMRRKSERLISSVRMFNKSCPSMMKKHGAFPRVIASRATTVTPLSAMKTPRVNVDQESFP